MPYFTDCAINREVQKSHEVGIKVIEKFIIEKFMTWAIPDEQIARKIKQENNIKKSA